MSFFARTPTWIWHEFDSPTHLYAASASVWPPDYTSSLLTKGDTCARLGACVGLQRLHLQNSLELKIQQSDTGVVPWTFGWKS